MSLLDFFRPIKPEPYRPVPCGCDFCAFEQKETPAICTWEWEGHTAWVCGEHLKVMRAWAEQDRAARDAEKRL
jgi:hypothetical protein